ncbi:phosphatidylglycerophosphatase A family protein [Rhizobacter sp. LjRoot28]|jgi:phosphatidylglycerophosphatase A|uniref:phosphatidylglycerophosphatase A family protein n=1 Tax=Rhizobacter sp. LjRoot28 TaxID=3342309 RepID=UPI003ECE1CA6
MNDIPVSPTLQPLGRAPVRRPTWRFMFRHPAHVIALGFGSGLSPVAPGTVGTLWAWLAFIVLQPVLSDLHWAALIGLGTLVGWWACTVTARHMAVADPGSIVWDEVIAFWLVLWLVTPTSLWGQCVAFALFRFFDAVKPGPVAWADARFKLRRDGQIGWRQGFGILFDDLVAALCTLLVLAAWRWL